MSKSQTDVDRVMAAFGAAPIRYRASQERAVTGAESASRAFETAVLRPVHNDPQLVGETPAPGAGGQIRQIFPLLSRAVPAVGDVPVDAVKRPGDELPLPPEPEPTLSPFDQALAEQAHLRTQSAGGTLNASQAAPAHAPAWAMSAATISPAPAEAPQPPAAQAAASQPAAPQQQAAPLPALRSHADLIQPLPSQPTAPQPAAPQPVPQQAAIEQAAPSYAPPQHAAPQTWAPPPMPPPPAYYPAPPPPYPYPYPPQPAPYPQAGYAPGYPPPAYPYPPMPAAPQPAPYPQAGYAPGYPPAYPPPAYAPQAYPYPPQPAPFGQPPAPPAYAAPPPPLPPPATAEPANLAAIFAALQRARGGPGTSGNR